MNLQNPGELTQRTFLLPIQRIYKPSRGQKDPKMPKKALFTVFSKTQKNFEAILEILFSRFFTKASNRYKLAFLMAVQKQTGKRPFIRIPIRLTNAFIA
jgi:hypothetical protein